VPWAICELGYLQKPISRRPNLQKAAKKNSAGSSSNIASLTYRWPKRWLPARPTYVEPQFTTLDQSLLAKGSLKSTANRAFCLYKQDGRVLVASVIP
jgi:hypothetical protein